LNHNIRRYWHQDRTLSFALATLGALLFSVAPASAQPRALVPHWGTVGGNSQVFVVDEAGVPLAPYALDPAGTALQPYATVATPDGTRMYVANDYGTGPDLLVQMVDLSTGQTTRVTGGPLASRGPKR
jgi:hypothetical protein